MKLTLHYGNGWIWLTSHADLLSYNTSFLLCQADNKNHPCYCTKNYIHNLLTHLVSPKWNKALLKILYCILLRKWWIYTENIYHIHHRLLRALKVPLQNVGSMYLRPFYSLTQPLQVASRNGGIYPLNCPEESDTWPCLSIKCWSLLFIQPSTIGL